MIRVHVILPGIVKKAYFPANEYEEKDDVVRIQVKPVKNAHTERLQYFIENNNKGNFIAVAWEKIKVEFPFTIKQ